MKWLVLAALLAAPVQAADDQDYKKNCAYWLDHLETIAWLEAALMRETDPGIRMHLKIELRGRMLDAASDGREYDEPLK